MTGDFEAAFGRSPFLVRSVETLPSGEVKIAVDRTGGADVDRDFYAAYAAVARDAQLIERAVEGDATVYRVSAGGAALLRLEVRAAPAPKTGSWTLMKRSFLLVLAVSLTICAVAGVVVLLVGKFGELEFRILGTSAAFACFSLTGLASGLWLGRDRFVEVSVIGLLCSAQGLILSLVIVWADFMHVDEALVKGWQTTILLTVGTAHASLILLAYGSHRGIDALIVTTIVIAFAVATILIGRIFEVWSLDNEVLGRVVGALSILAALGTILGPILRRALTART